MPHSQHQLASGICLDSRRAAWLPAQRILAVADLHLGYAWAQRHRGQLLPLSKAEDSVQRLLELQSFYQPREIILLGDIVHRALAHPALKAELKQLCWRVAEKSRLCWIVGNHDAGLESLLAACDTSARALREFQVDRWLFVHGDGPDTPVAIKLLQRIRDSGGCIVMGHEHPAVNIGDGVATSAKCPCFLISEDVLVLPAFSNWAAGSVARRRGFLSPLARQTRFAQAIAILGDKLLPINLEK